MQHVPAAAGARLNRADGTVLMGINLQRQLRASRDNPDVAVVAVLRARVRPYQCSTAIA